MEKSRACFCAAGFVFTIFIVDILIAKVQVLSGITIPVHLGDILQFLVFLVAVAFFVVGALFRESQEGQYRDRAPLPGDDTPTSGRA